jgi:single-stranded DNA-binding protein
VALLTFAGRLTADPVLDRSDRTLSAEFVVAEDTGAYVRGEWVPHAVPTTRHVRTPHQMAETVASTLRAGVHVVVTGRERTERRTTLTGPREVRVVEAVRVGVLLTAEQSVVVEPTPGAGAWWPADV